jgi:iron(III) transport system permease protein
MSLRKQPLLALVAALVVFGLAAILPLAWMLAQFLVRLFARPGVVAALILDQRQLILLARSLMIALASALVALVIGLPVAVLLAARDLPLRRFFFFLVLIPVLIPSYVMAGAWIHLFSPMGTLNKTLTSLLGPTAALTVHSPVGCAWCLGVSFFPVVAVIVATGLSRLDATLRDIATLSTGRWGLFWHSTLPQIRPHIVASVCLVLIFVLAQYGVPSLLGVNTYPVEIFAHFSAFYDDTAAVATSLPLIALVVFLILLQRGIMGGHDYVNVTPSSETANPVRLGRARPLALVFLILLFVVTVVLPFAAVMAQARGLPRILSSIGLFSDYVLTTGLMALLAAAISTSIAFPIGRFLAHRKGPLTGALDILCWLPIAIPGTIFGLGLIKLGNLSPILRADDSFGILLLIAYVGMFSAFAIRVFEAAHRRADPNIDQKAALDCLTWRQRLWHIDLPLHAGPIAVSFIVVFVLVVGELNATVLLIPPGKTTLSISIDNLLHYGASATASALCLIEAGLVILAVLAGLLICRLVRSLLAFVAWRFF